MAADPSGRGPRVTYRNHRETPPEIIGFFPGLKTENGVATFGQNDRGAWFKDSEGNILAVVERH